jgi:hypothetical protein
VRTQANFSRVRIYFSRVKKPFGSAPKQQTHLSAFKNKEKRLVFLLFV